jgi:hypothetical protein
LLQSNHYPNVSLPSAQAFVMSGCLQAYYNLCQLYLQTCYCNYSLVYFLPIYFGQLDRWPHNSSPISPAIFIPDSTQVPRLFITKHFLLARQTNCYFMTLTSDTCHMTCFLVYNIDWTLSCHGCRQKKHVMDRCGCSGRK